VAPKLTVSAWLYQPFLSAIRDGVAVAWGAVASYFSPYDAEPLLPALSVHEPFTAPVALSGPEYVLSPSH
jgi:hypothetical protein